MVSCCSEKCLSNCAGLTRPFQLIYLELFLWIIHSEDKKCSQESALLFSSLNDCSQQAYDPDFWPSFSNGRAAPSRMRTLQRAWREPGPLTTILGKAQRALVSLRILLWRLHQHRTPQQGLRQDFPKQSNSKVINMLAVLENVRISGHHQFVIVEVLQVKLKGKVWVTNFSNQNSRDKIIPNVLLSMT